MLAKGCAPRHPAEAPLKRRGFVRGARVLWGAPRHPAEAPLKLLRIADVIHVVAVGCSSASRRGSFEAVSSPSLYSSNSSCSSASRRGSFEAGRRRRRSGAGRLGAPRHPAEAPLKQAIGCEFKSHRSHRAPRHPAEAPLKPAVPTWPRPTGAECSSASRRGSFEARKAAPQERLTIWCSSASRRGSFEAYVAPYLRSDYENSAPRHPAEAPLKRALAHRLRVSSAAVLLGIPPRLL